MFTIEDLKQGRCAVINDGTLEELREVLRLAFPDSILDVSLDKNTNLPTQSVKDFLNKEIFN